MMLRFERAVERDDKRIIGERQTEMRTFLSSQTRRHFIKAVENHERTAAALCGA